MNDDSLFKDDIQYTQPVQNNDDPTNIDPNPLLTNLKLLLTYFAFMVVASIVSIFIGQIQSNRTAEWIEGDLDYTVTLENDEYIMNYFGNVSNTTDQDIDNIYFFFNLLDDEGNLIETVEHRVRHLEVGETITIDSDKVVQMSPANVEIQFQIPGDPTLSNVIQMVVTFLVLVALWYLNKRDFVNDYKKYKQSPKEFFGFVITGFALVYASNIAANIIMQLIDATDTSLNESAIQSMFSANAINLGALFLNLVILTPIVEETVFRKGLYGLVDHKFGDVAAILVSGFVFAFLHVAGWGDYINIIPYLFMGLSFSFIYYYSKKNIYVVIIIHMINNLIPFSIYLIDALS